MPLRSVCKTCSSDTAPYLAGNSPVELQPSEEAPVDDDDASSATETCESVSVCDSEAPAEPILHSAGDLNAAGTQPVPLLDTDQVQRMLEPRSRRSFRTPGSCSQHLKICQPWTRSACWSNTLQCLSTATLGNYASEANTFQDVKEWVFKLE